MQVGKGIGRIMMCRADGVADIVPVDIAINLIIAAAWSTATERLTMIYSIFFTNIAISKFPELMFAQKRYIVDKLVLVSCCLQQRLKIIHYSFRVYTIIIIL